MEQLTENNPGKYTYTKYPVDWPGTGDPYYTEEAGTRVVYYAVATVPMLFLDGENQSTSIAQGTLTQHYDSPAYANIRGAYNIEGNVINVTADFMAYADMDNVRAYISVNEKVTKENTGSNGETEFHRIMMKMLEGDEGNIINIKAGKYQRLSFSYDMSSTNVEDINDLEVALWLQDYDSKVIYNSHFAYENSIHCYPVQNHQMTENENELQAIWQAPIDGTPTRYDIYLNGEKVMENTMEMSYTIANNGGIYIIEVIALYGDKSSVGSISSNIEEEEETPCEAPTNLNASVEQNVNGFGYNFKVTMSWDNVDYAQQYKLYLDGEMIETLATTSFVKGFDEEGEHHFAVAAVCENGESAQSEEFSFKLNGISIKESSENDFKIHPNPANNFVKLSAVSDQPSVVRIYNTLGMLLEEIEMNSNEIEINISDYKSGIYFINVETENGNVTKKMVVR